MKFVLWGAGTIGKRVLKFLGKDYVVAFIDINRKIMEAGVVEGIPVISFSEYKEKYANSLIVITASDAMAGNIENVIVRDDIYSYMRLNESLNRFYEYNLQEASKHLYMLQEKNEVIFTGPDVLAILFGEMLYKKYELKTKMLVLDDFPAERLETIRSLCPWLDVERLKHADISNKGVILMNETGDFRRKLFEKNAIICYFDSALRMSKSQYISNALKRFKDIHKGKRCFIVATGPSLKVSDLEVLDRNNEISFSMNRINLIFEKTAWKPHYYVASDPRMLEYFGREIKDICKIAAFVSDHYPGFIPKEENIFQFHTMIDTGMPRGFATEISRGMYSALNVMYFCLQISIYMGFDEIYLLGVDFDNYIPAPGRKLQHFTDAYKTEEIKEIENQDGFMDEYIAKAYTLRGYELAKEIADMKGIKIYNATRGGRLEVYERRNFDELF